MELTPEQKLEKRIADAKAKINDNKESERILRLEQYADDMEAQAELEVQHGEARVVAFPLDCWTPGRGAATMLIAVLPETRDSKVKRLQQIASNDKISAAEKLEASEALARQCIVYPGKKTHEEMYNATVELAPGVLNHAARHIYKRIQGRELEEGK
jgi:hypothetical protein